MIALIRNLMINYLNLGFCGESLTKSSVQEITDWGILMIKSSIENRIIWSLIRIILIPFI